jgi:hypothetical protein
LILCLDGDDLWCRNWVSAAWAEHLTSTGWVILHPRHAVFFGAQLEILVHSDWRDPYFDPRALVSRNYWISLCGVRRDLLVDCPFPKTDASRGIGHEDWSWYRDTIARGVAHVTVANTVHFVRLKTVNSRQRASQGYFCTPSVEYAEYIAADDPTRPYDL